MLGHGGGAHPCLRGRVVHERNYRAVTLRARAPARYLSRGNVGVRAGQTTFPRKCASPIFGRVLRCFVIDMSYVGDCPRHVPADLTVSVKPHGGPGILAAGEPRVASGWCGCVPRRMRQRVHSFGGVSPKAVFNVAEHRAPGSPETLWRQCFHIRLALVVRLNGVWSSKLDAPCPSGSHWSLDLIAVGVLRSITR